MFSGPSPSTPEQEQPGPLAGAHASRTRRAFSRHPWPRLLYLALVTLCLTSWLFTDIIGNLPIASARASSPTSLPIPQASYTLQQYLKQGQPYRASDAPLPLANSAHPSPAAPSAATRKQAMPSAEPASMKAVSQSISVSATATASSAASNGATGNPALHLVGSDANGVRLELSIPAGALDLSHATTTRNTAPQGALTLSLTQNAGHFVGMTTELGEFQVQLTDAQGLVVHGIKLRTPATFTLHYRQNELQALDLDASKMLMSWPTILTGATASHKGSATVIPMQADLAASTLTARSTVLDSAVVALGISNPQNQTPPKPRFASTGGNTGQLNYNYPLVVAAGPQGTTPTLTVKYSSASTNSRNSPFSPADAVGEGWQLSMGSISENVEAGGAVWYSISGIDNISDRLMPNSSTVGAGTFFATEHLSYLKIEMVSAGFDSQNCFHVWDTSGTYYEFGCTHDSMQYFTTSSNNRTNYRYDLDKVIPTNDGNANRSITLSYVQVPHTDSNGHYTIEDAALKQITYGTSTNQAGTVDFFYKGPSAISSNGTQWVTAYGNNEGGCKPPDGLTTTERCDDPQPKSGGLDDPLTKSVLSLSTVKTYVGDDSSSSHLDYSYALTYTDTAFTSCTDPQSGTSGYCAGNHLLTSITPTVYQNGTGHALPGMSFGYSDDQTRLNKYEDNSHSVPQGGNYKVQTNWRFLTSYHDHSNGVGATILYHTAYNNSNGTPYSSDGDNRYDPFYCVWHSGDCGSGTSFYPMYNKMWTQQVVYQITSIGTDSSASGLVPGTTTYHYLLARTTGSCAADSKNDTDCVGFGWIPDTSDGWQDYYHGEFRGFGEVDITSPSGNLTVQKYYATEGWDSSSTDATNYLAGSMYEEDAYQGGTIKSGGANLLKQTTNVFAGTNGTHTACTDDYVSGDYSNCEVIQLSSKTTTYEQTGTGNANAPWVQTTDTYDDYNSSSGLISGTYHNKLSEVITSSNAPTRTQNWRYQTTDTTVNGTVYYNVHSTIHSEIVDASGHTWSCSDITFDEGRASGVPSPAAGLATTVKTYSNCADSSAATTTYTGYDVNGNAVATVDGVATANPGLYSSAGCTLSTTPVYLSSAWTAGHYTTCTAYDPTSALSTDTWNALNQHTSAAYDPTQGLLQTSSTDINGQVTTQSQSYDSSGNTITNVKLPGETANYSQQGTLKSTCTDSSTLPCLEEDGNNSLYSNAVTQTFYDSLGRKVETLTPGPGATQTTVSYTVYNDSTNSVFESQPFVVASRTTWLDPNASSASSIGGTASYLDALGRTIAVRDALFQSGTLSGIPCAAFSGANVTTCTIYGLGTVSGDSRVYTLTTDVDANNHVQRSYADALKRASYAIDESGVNNGTLTPNRVTVYQYNALDRQTSVTVTDLAPNNGQSVTSVITSTTYDDLGNVTGVNDPDRGTMAYSYDADGQLLTAISGSHTVGISYDLLGRVGCIQDAAPTPNASGACSSGSHVLVQNTYDTSSLQLPGTTSYAVGQLTQSVSTTYYPDSSNLYASSSTVTTQLEYDQRERLSAANQQVGVPSSWGLATALPTDQVTQSYNDADQPTTTQTTVGNQPGYTFSQAYDGTTGTLIGLSNNATRIANLVSQSFDNSGNVSALNFLSNTGTALATDAFIYDGDLRPARSAMTWSGNSTPVFNKSWTYDPAGNVVNTSTTLPAVPGQSASGGSDVENFCYNEQNQLVWAGNSGTEPSAGNGTCGSATLANSLHGASYSNSYVYTHLGQLWQGPLNGIGSQQQYLYCNSNQPHQLTGLYPLGTSCTSLSGATYTAGYDSRGNQISRGYNGTNATLSYDLLNRLEEWNAGSTDQEWYGYDDAGQRVLKMNTNSNGTSLTVYAFGLEEHVYDASGSNIGNTYYYTLDGRLVGKSDGAMIDYYLTDAQGSVLATFSNGANTTAMIGDQIYNPYGQVLYRSGSMGTSVGYTGQREDVTGLDYFIGRYYDPVLGQFVSADPIEGNSQGLNPYAYVYSNPETWIDPSGYTPDDGPLRNNPDFWKGLQDYVRDHARDIILAAGIGIGIATNIAPPPQAAPPVTVTVNDTVDEQDPATKKIEIKTRPATNTGAGSDPNSGSEKSSSGTGYSSSSGKYTSDQKVKPTKIRTQNDNIRGPAGRYRPQQVGDPGTASSPVRPGGIGVASGGSNVGQGPAINVGNVGQASTSSISTSNSGSTNHVPVTITVTSNAPPSSSPSWWDQAQSWWNNLKSGWDEFWNSPAPASGGPQCACGFGGNDSPDTGGDDEPFLDE